jgi:tRNA U34 5-methylaminomethyl-2-thiouridine-forming methyltransferase MnmC
MNMDFKKFNWIRTRDGSPTLWHNDEGAAFRSQKGAFTESLCAFVRPALEHLLKHPRPQIQVVEFGLGPGTNWALWQLSTAALGLRPSLYTAIEKDAESFEIGFDTWCENVSLLARFVAEEWELPLTEEEALQTLQEARTQLQIIRSLDELPHTADVWLHDPFGYDVNPSAYQEESLKKIFEKMHPEARGYSYACNVPFQKALRACGFELDTPETGNFTLKRERLEFWRSLTKNKHH